MIINQFFVLQAHSQPNFCLLISGCRKKYLSKGEVGNGKYLGMANYNIYFKKNLNRLAMNITQTNFVY